MTTARERYLLERCLKYEAALREPAHTRRILTPFDHALARALRRQGWSMASVAKAMKVGRETVRRWERD